MGLLDGKDWQAQSFYNEYLELKQEILQLSLTREHFLRHGKEIVAQEMQDDIDKKVVRFKFILNQLKIMHGIAMEDLILLSIGIDV